MTSAFCVYNLQSAELWQGRWLSSHCTGSGSGVGLDSGEAQSHSSSEVLDTIIEPFN